MHDLGSFLRGFAPRWVCPDCLASLMHEDPASVTEHVNSHSGVGHFEARQGECLNCRETRTVYRSLGS